MTHVPAPEGVAKTNDKVMVTGDVLFRVAGGPIQVLGLVSECVTGNDTTASTLQYQAAPTIGTATAICGASATLASALAGATVALIGTALTTPAVVNANGPGLGMTTPSGILVPVGTIRIVVGVGSTTGKWRHYLRYRPMALGVTVTI